MSRCKTQFTACQPYGRTSAIRTPYTRNLALKRFNALLAAVLALALCANADAQNPNAGQRGNGPRGQQGQRQRGQRPQGQRPQGQMGQRPNLKPTLFANLGDRAYTPDGMAIHSQTGQLYLNVPNFVIGRHFFEWRIPDHKRRIRHSAFRLAENKRLKRRRYPLAG